MFRRIATALGAGLVLCAPMAALAHGGGGGGGGGHGGGHGGRYVYVTVFINGVAVGFAGVPAEMPVELTDAPLQRADGEMAPTDVIAQHTLRARDAVVLLQDLPGKDQPIPAGTVFARITTPMSGVDLWCQISATHGLFRRALNLCLRSRDGKFVQSWTGEAPSHFLGIYPAVVREGPMLAAPVAYRPARPEERPIGLLGYRWCEGDGASGPPRFSLAVTIPGDDKWASSGVVACRYGVWPSDTDHGRVRVDALTLTVTPAQTPPHLKFSVAGRLPPLAEIEPLTPTNSVHAVHAVSAASAASAAGAAATTAAAPGAAIATPAVTQAPPRARDRLLLPDGPPEVVSGAVLKKGDVLARMPVRHGVTARLRSEVRIRDTFDPMVLPVNQPLFGLPPADPEGDIVWCAPRAVPTEGHKAPVWSTVCLAQRDGATFAMEAPIAMMVTSLPWTKARLTSPPTIERGPAGLPPMMMSWAFAGFTDPALPTRFARIEIRLDWGEGPRVVKSISAPIGADGVAGFALQGGHLSLRAAPPAPGRKGHEAEAQDQAALTVDAPLQSLPPF